MPSRSRHRWLTLLDGPLAGELYSASLRSPSSPILRLSRAVPGRIGMMELHEYRLVGPLTARWMRHVETRPVPFGAA